MTFICSGKKIKQLKFSEKRSFFRIYCFFITNSEISEVFKVLQLFSQSLWNQVKRVNRGIGLNVLILTRNSDTEIYSKFLVWNVGKISGNFFL